MLLIEDFIFSKEWIIYQRVPSVYYTTTFYKQLHNAYYYKSHILMWKT